MDQINILVVDDEKEIADLVEIYLVSDGYKVFKASPRSLYPRNRRNRVVRGGSPMLSPTILGWMICRTAWDRT